MSTRELLVKFQAQTDPSVDRSANDTARAIRGVGDAADQSADRQDRATGRIAGPWAALTATLINLGLQAGSAVVGVIFCCMYMDAPISKVMIGRPCR